jgi:hypothetical protein
MPGFTQIPNDEVFDNPLWIADQFTRGQAFIDLYRLAQYTYLLKTWSGRVVYGEFR